MRIIYSFLVQLIWMLLHFVALFHPKIKRFIKGRRKTFSILKKNFPSAEEVIWMHVASLGEYEQGLPLLEELKNKYPQYKMILTFFSPSGYEVKKENTPADVVVYLPMDTLVKAKKFMKIVSPKIAIFIKYEIWPNLLFELHQQKVPTFLVSGIFSERQAYFKWYGRFMRKALRSFNHFFVQEENSAQLLHTIGFQNVTISGDTRFDRVYKILNQNNHLEFMQVFKGMSKCFVAGSTWPEDEAVILNYINAPQTKAKVVIAPHNINPKHIASLHKSISKKTALYSNRTNENIADAEVLIIDTIGLLTKIYSYADIAYVGGGFATGLHNTLEPAVFHIPVIIGPNYNNFNEAKELVHEQGVLSISNKETFENLMDKLMEDDHLLKMTGSINSAYIEKKKGATQKVMNHLKSIL